MLYHYLKVAIGRLLGMSEFDREHTLALRSEEMERHRFQQSVSAKLAQSKGDDNVAHAAKSIPRHLFPRFFSFLNVH